MVSYTLEEIAQVIAEHASNSLPPDAPNGIMKAVFNDDGSIDIYYIPKQESKDNN